MAEQVRVDAENYTILVDPTIATIVHRWEEFTSGQEFRDGCNELLEFVEEHDYNKIVIDTSGIKAHRDEDKEWLQEEWIPKEIEAGIDYSVSVPGDSIISEREMETFVDQAAGLPFTYVLAEDMEGAKEWIAGQ